ncbi:hypothetical protein IAD21_01189 [Abditibacteriota bacterium]|nr:hypothetical protein IAD21_01189 [Abditibacteriota bacterium]
MRHLFSLFSLLTLCALAHAHNGLPTLVLQNKVSGPYKVTLWADPHVGQGNLSVVLTPTGQTPPDQAPDKVEVAVQPTSKRLDEKIYPAKLKFKFQRQYPYYYAEVPFDKVDSWDVRVLLHNQQKVDVVTAQMGTKADNLNPWFLPLYALPFAVIGLIWIRAARKKTGSPTEI